MKHRVFKVGSVQKDDENGIEVSSSIYLKFEEAPYQPVTLTFGSDPTLRIQYEDGEEDTLDLGPVVAIESERQTDGRWSSDEWFHGWRYFYDFVDQTGHPIVSLTSYEDAFGDCVFPGSDFCRRLSDRYGWFFTEPPLKTTGMSGAEVPEWRSGCLVILGLVVLSALLQGC